MKKKYIRKSPLYTANILNKLRFFVHWIYIACRRILATILNLNHSKSKKCKFNFKSIQGNHKQTFNVNRSSKYLFKCF